MGDNYSMDEVVLDEVTEEVNDKRPVFILVLCILTWFWSGVFSIGATIGSIINYDKQVAEFKKSREAFDGLSNDNPGDEFAKDMMGGIMDSADGFLVYGQTLNYITLITGILCVIGAILMFKLKRVGYYIYVVSTLVFIAAPIYLMGGNLLALGTSVFYGFFGLLFMILYGVNFKYLK